MQCPFFNYNSRVQDPDLLLNHFIELKNMTIWLIQPIEGAANPVQFNGLLTLIGWLSAIDIKTFQKQCQECSECARKLVKKLGRVLNKLGLWPDAQTLARCPTFREPIFQAPVLIA
jgi:hypothetical protein